VRIAKRTRNIISNNSYSTIFTLPRMISKFYTWRFCTTPNQHFLLLWTI